MDSKQDLPLGLGMALAQNVNAMKSFCAMSSEKQRQIIERTQSIKSKEEMQSFVESLDSMQG